MQRCLVAGLTVVLALVLFTASSSAAALTPKRSAVNPVAQEAYAKELGVSSAKAYENLAVQSRGAGLVDAVMSTLGRGYAGFWFDDDSGRFKIGVAPSTDAAEAAKLVAERDLTGDTDFVPVKSTWDDLKSAQQGLLQRVSKYGASVRVGIDVSANGLVADAANDDAETDLDRLSAASSTQSGADDEVNVSVRRVSRESLAMPPSSCSFPNCDHPLRGGVQIWAAAAPVRPVLLPCAEPICSSSPRGTASTTLVASALSGTRRPPPAPPIRSGPAAAGSWTPAEMRARSTCRRARGGTWRAGPRRPPRGTSTSTT
jgi:hypothetical protein